jgi:hypothetical protein
VLDSPFGAHLETEQTHLPLHAHIHFHGVESTELSVLMPPGSRHARLEDLAGLGALDPAKVAEVNQLWARVGAALVGLIRRHS